MKSFWFVPLLFCALTAWAQEHEVELNEVVVKGARTVQLADRQVIYPTQQQRQASTSGYGLLAQLALPHIRVDEASHSIAALGSTRAAPEVRINDVKATEADLLSLEMQAVEAVEFIDHPGVRYGDDVAYVINIKVRRPVSGYAVGADLTLALTMLRSDGTVYGKANFGKSELGLSYRADYAHWTGTRTNEQATYLLADGSHYTLNRRTLDDDDLQAKHQLQLTYSLSDSLYEFQARLSGSAPLGPSRQTSTHDYTADALTQTYTNRSSDHTKSPSLDLYYHRDFRRHQSLTANAMGTYIHSRSYNERNEGTDYTFHTTGHTYSLWAEAVYENRLKPFTLSSGMQYLQRYTDNSYHGDAEAHNAMHTSGAYGFGQLSGRLFQRLQYVAGLGLYRRYFSQADSHHDFLLLRPKLSLSYALASRWRLKYDFEISQHVSQIALVSSVHIKQNAMETLVGNPDIRPNRVISHDLRLTYTAPRLTTELHGYYRGNAHCNMEKTAPTSSMPSLAGAIATPFFTTQTNSRACNMFYVESSGRWSILPQRLELTAYGGVYRFFNLGDDYTHTYTAFNGAAWLQAYLGRWTLMAYADNGYRWMEGEHRGHQGAFWQLSATCRLNSHLTLSLRSNSPFSAHPTANKSELRNRYVHKHFTETNADLGNNLMLTLTWHTSHGRSYRDIQRTLNHQDSETGILK